MNYKRLFLLSFGVNLLLVALWLLRSSRPTTPSQFVSEISTDSSGANLDKVAGAKVRPHRASTETAGTRKIIDWRAVESPDYREYLANLRTIGCPEATIRDIISADLKQLYKSRNWNAVSPASGVVRYWETDFSFSIGEHQFNQMRALENEYRSTFNELLGTEPPKSESSFSEMNSTEMEVLRGFGALADSKFDQVTEWELRKRDRGKTLDPTSESYADDILKIQAEAEKELAKILTPDELEQHQLRTSPLASKLREQLSDFHPSEGEFVELFRLRAQFQDPFAKDQPLNEQTQRELQSQLRAMLGPTRYADYERSVGAQLPAR